MDTPSEYSSDGLMAKICNEKNVTKDDIIREADVIWSKSKGVIKDPRQSDEVNELMAKIRRDHKDFCTSYPIVMRYMTQFNTYRRKTFVNYLNKIEKYPWKSEDEYLESQVDYVVMLHKDTHTGKHLNATEKGNLRSNIRLMLAEESKKFKENLKESEEAVKKLEQEIREETVSDMSQYFRKILTSPPDGSIRVEFQDD